jgi:hypothetical protein
VVLGVYAYLNHGMRATGTLSSWPVTELALVGHWSGADYNVLQGTLFSLFSPMRGSVATHSIRMKS